MNDNQLKQFIEWIKINKKELSEKFSWEGKYIGGGDHEFISFKEWVEKHKPTFISLKDSTWLKNNIVYPYGRDGMTDYEERNLQALIEEVKLSTKDFEIEQLDKKLAQINIKVNELKKLFNRLWNKKLELEKLKNELINKENEGHQELLN